MSRSKELTPKSFPKSWEDQPAFREIFLVNLPPHLADCCQEVGKYFFTVLLEANMSDADPDDLVRRVAADLYHACLALNALLDYDQLDLGDRISGWRDRVCQVADEMKVMTEPHAD